MTHHQSAVVVSTHPIYALPHKPTVLALQFPDGRQVGVPCGFDVAVGDCLMVVSEHERRLVETYRENMKSPSS